MMDETRKEEDIWVEPGADDDKQFSFTTLRCAVKFGFRGCEKGHSLQEVLESFDKLLQKWYG